MPAACEEIGSAPTESRGTGSSNPVPSSGESCKPSVPRDFSPLCRTRLGAVIEGRARSSGDQEQVVDHPFGSLHWRQAILARRALPDLQIVVRSFVFF